MNKLEIWPACLDCLWRELKSDRAINSDGCRDVETCRKAPVCRYIKGQEMIGGTVRRDADLTCRNVSRYLSEDMNNGIPQFQCSECGAILCDKDWSMHYNNSACIVSKEGGGEGLTHVSYCPNCGARVVSE